MRVPTEKIADGEGKANDNRGSDNRKCGGKAANLPRDFGGAAGVVRHPGGAGGIHQRERGQALFRRDGRRNPRRFSLPEGDGARHGGAVRDGRFEGAAQNGRGARAGGSGQADGARGGLCVHGKNFVKEYFIFFSS